MWPWRALAAAAAVGARCSVLGARCSVLSCCRAPFARPRLVCASPRQLSLLLLLLLPPRPSSAPLPARTRASQAETPARHGTARPARGASFALRGPAGRARGILAPLTRVSSSVLAGRSSRNSDHHNTCLELLINGNVDAFVELFELTSKGARRLMAPNRAASMPALPAPALHRTAPHRHWPWRFHRARAARVPRGGLGLGSKDGGRAFSRRGVAPRSPSRRRRWPAMLAGRPRDAPQI